ncbi:unnamed protein product [Lactuca virosa]|uniref:Uncharacterized protein n=1 Tax=Lactuca virosa TaxID=75947 RepID=A0AAU9PXE9_9ASTR|nr:unnamed protein product [Lactuca virosa]
MKTISSSVATEEDSKLNPSGDEEHPPITPSSWTVAQNLGLLLFKGFYKILNLPHLLLDSTIVKTESGFSKSAIASGQFENLNLYQKGQYAG